MISTTLEIIEEVDSIPDEELRDELVMYIELTQALTLVIEIMTDQLRIEPSLAITYIQAIMGKYDNIGLTKSMTLN